MTAATPMMTPSIVSAARNALPRIESSASRTVSQNGISGSAACAAGAFVVAGCCVSPGMPPRRLATSWICCWISTRLAVGSSSTSSPSPRPPVISTRSRSVTPVSTGVGVSRPSLTTTTQSPRPSPSAPPRAPVPPCPRPRVRAPPSPAPTSARNASASRPRICAVASMSRAARSAITGRVSTPDRSATLKVASTFMPGRSRPSSFATLISTANIVTFWSTTACGSIFSTVPSNSRPGNAATWMRAGTPASSLPMSVSSTRTRARTCVRSAIVRITVPPPTSRVGEEITCPRSTRRVRIVPDAGARTSVSSSSMRAFSRVTRAATAAARVFATSSSSVSSSDWLIHAFSRSFSPRSSWVCAVFSRCRAALSSACAWSTRFLGVRGSMRTRSVPASTVSPISAASCEDLARGF